MIFNMLNQETGRLELFGNMEDYTDEYEYCLDHSCDDYGSNTDENAILNYVVRLLFYTLTSVVLLFTGTVISSTIISYYMFNVPEINKICEDISDDISEDSDDNYIEDDDTPYEYKYVKDFEMIVNSDTPHRELSESDKMNLSNSVIMETTPNGNVVLSYNYDKEVPERSMFTYYCDNKSIPYKYLDAVARKYAFVYKCPEIYVYIKDELMKEAKRFEEEKKREEERKDDKTNVSKKSDNVFATFKKYKNPGNSTVKKRHILVAKNKYKHLGTIEDYNKSLLPKDEKKEVKPISFSEFKQMNKCS